MSGRKNAFMTCGCRMTRQDRYRETNGKMMHQEETIVNDSSEFGKKEEKYQKL